MSVLDTVVVALFVSHIIAVSFGAACITFAEWRYFRAIADGKIDSGERAHLVTLFFSLRFALVMVILVDIALGFALYVLGSSLTPSLTPSYWFETLIIFTLIFVSWLRFHGRIPFWAGSSIAFVGWWYLVGMDIGFVPIAGIGTAIFGFVASVVVMAALFGYTRFIVRTQIST